MNGKIHISHIVPSFEVGGLQNGIVNLMNHMNTDIFEFSICTFEQFMGESRNRVKRRDVQYYALNKREGNDFSLPRKLTRIFKQEHVTIVHTHNWGTYLEGLIAAKLARVPIMIHGEHGTVFFNKFRRRRAYRMAAHFTNQILTVSGELSKLLVNQVGISPEKVKVIINGVDTNKFRPKFADRNRLRNMLGLNGDEVVIGSVGRLAPIKDYPTFLRAFACVLRQYTNVFGVLVGDGPLRAELEKQANELGIASRFRFLGERDDVFAWLNAFDVFVLPSLHEGISNTILEAMATKLPIVATRVGGNPEIVHDKVNGLLVPSQNEEALAEALIQFIQNEALRYQFGEASLARVMSDFSLQRMVKEYEELYLQLVERERR
jgi:sugar transferase (PEP-CTERM/EpsH1 system associated)